RAKSVALCELIVALHDAWLAPLGFSLGSPREPERRGSHVAVRHPDAWPICRALIERAHVVPDFRGPDAIRLGVAPLYTGYADVLLAIEVTGITATPSPICSERADAKNALIPAASATSTNGAACSTPSETLPVAALTATWLTVNSSPDATPSRMPLRESWRWE